MDGYITTISENFNNLIIDNAQSFYSKPNKQVATYYSPRKFFGIPDGGYLASNAFIDFELDIDTSHEYANFLMARIDAGAEVGYRDFRSSEDRIRTIGLKRMSKLTAAILSSIDYTFVKQKRERNFYYIHYELGIYNQLKSIPTNVSGPMTYPFLIDKSGLREFLISNKVFVAKYWDNVSKICQESSYENFLATQLVALPVDQRYDETEMKHIVNLVKSFCNIEIDE
jgi:hypothetical protein